MSVSEGSKRSAGLRRRGNGEKDSRPKDDTIPLSSLNVDYSEASQLLRDEDSQHSLASSGPRTPLQMCVAALGDNSCDGFSVAPETPQRAPEQNPGTPLTPLANLKVLIAAASSALDRERECASSQQATAPTVNGGGCEEESGGRKTKSLAVLCKKFLSIVESDVGAGNEFSLETMAQSLGTNRRRIYDIINCLEALEMIVKQSKNWYTWLGKCSLVRTLAKLRAMCLDDPEFQSLFMEESNKENEGHAPSSSASISHKQRKADTVVAPGTSCEGVKEEGEDVFVTGDDGGPQGCGVSGGGRWDKSLGVLCQKFVMLFLASPHHELTLEFAGGILMPDCPEDCPPFSSSSSHSTTTNKTKVRRLYDIANVLTTLDLIKKKTFMAPNHRKMPGYAWCGPSMEDISAITVLRKRDFGIGAFYPKKKRTTSLTRSASFSGRPFLHQYEVKVSPMSTPSTPKKSQSRTKTMGGAGFRRSLSFGGSSATNKSTVTARPLCPKQMEYMNEVKAFEAEMKKHSHRYPHVASLFEEFIHKYQSTLEQAASSGRSILPKPSSPPSLIKSNSPTAIAHNSPTLVTAGPSLSPSELGSQTVSPLCVGVSNIGATTPQEGTAENAGQELAAPLITPAISDSASSLAITEPAIDPTPSSTGSGTDSNLGANTGLAEVISIANTDVLSALGLAGALQGSLVGVIPGLCVSSTSGATVSGASDETCVQSTLSSAGHDAEASQQGTAAFPVVNSTPSPNPCIAPVPGDHTTHPLAAISTDSLPSSELQHPLASVSNSGPNPRQQFGLATAPSISPTALQPNASSPVCIGKNITVSLLASNQTCSGAPKEDSIPISSCSTGAHTVPDFNTCSAASSSATDDTSIGTQALPLVPPSSGLTVPTEVTHGTLQSPAKPAQPKSFVSVQEFLISQQCSPPSAVSINNPPSTCSGLISIDIGTLLGQVSQQAVCPLHPAHVNSQIFPPSGVRPLLPHPQKPPAPVFKTHPSQPQPTTLAPKPTPGPHSFPVTDPTVPTSSTSAFSGIVNQRPIMIPAASTHRSTGLSQPSSYAPAQSVRIAPCSVARPAQAVTIATPQSMPMDLNAFLMTPTAVPASSIPLSVADLLLMQGSLAAKGVLCPSALASSAEQTTHQDYCKIHPKVTLDSDLSKSTPVSEPSPPKKPRLG